MARLNTLAWTFMVFSVVIRPGGLPSGICVVQVGWRPPPAHAAMPRQQDAPGPVATELFLEGKSDAQVKDHLAQRYGEFVLYKPRVEGRTWLLWLGPALILLAGAALVVALVRRKSAQAIPRNNEPQEW